MESKTNKVYSVTFTEQVQAGLVSNVQFDLSNIGRNFKIKSIYFDSLFIELAGGALLPKAMNTTQISELQIGLPPAILTNPFNNFVPTLPLLFLATGTAYYMLNPGTTMQFNSFFASDQLRFNYVGGNEDILLDYYHAVTVVCEIEDTLLK